MTKRVKSSSNVTPTFVRPQKTPNKIWRPRPIAQLRQGSLSRIYWPPKFLSDKKPELIGKALINALPHRTGGQGQIYRGNFLYWGQDLKRRLIPVAVKQPFLTADHLIFDLEIASWEWEIMRHLRGLRCIPEIQEAWFPGLERNFFIIGGSNALAPPLVIMKFIRGRTLHDIMSHYLEREEYVPINMTTAITYCLLKALYRLEERRVVHRDIKSTNVMIDFRGDLKILDFGLALIELNNIYYGMLGENEAAGTLPYIAPEYLSARIIGPKQDVWAVGVLLIEMLSGDNTFLRELSAVSTNGGSGLEKNKIKDAILKKDLSLDDIVGKRKDVPQPLVDLAYKLLDRNFFSRYSAFQGMRFIEGRLGYRLKAGFLDLKALGEEIRAGEIIQT